MTVAVLDAGREFKVSFARWRAGANTVVLWGAILLLVVYPLAMVVVAAFAPAFPDSQPLRLADFLSERLFTASINTLRLGIAVSLLSLLTGAAFAPARLAESARALDRSDHERAVPYPALSRLARLESGRGLERLLGASRPVRRINGAGDFFFLGVGAADGRALRADRLLRRARADGKSAGVVTVGWANRGSEARTNRSTNPIAAHISRALSWRLPGLRERHRGIWYASGDRQPHRLPGAFHRDRPHRQRLSDQSNFG